MIFADPCVSYTLIRLIQRRSFTKEYYLLWHRDMSRKTSCGGVNIFNDGFF